MRGAHQSQDELFCTISIEKLVPSDHPLRRIEALADAALARMEARFGQMYSRMGRPSVAPERLLRALLLQVLYGYHSERRLMAELQYNFAFRWFVGLTMGEDPWDVTVFTKNRKRFLDGDVAQEWLKAIVLEARDKQLLDEEHFSVDGTLIQAWVSERSYQPKQNPPAPGEGTGRCGKLLKRDLYESTTDPDAQMARKHYASAWLLAYRGNLVMENRSGLIVASEVSKATQTSEREYGLKLLTQVRALFGKANGTTEMTVGADKAYNERVFVEGARNMNIEPHIGAYRCNRRDHVGAAVRQTEAYQDSVRKRKWIERCFAWLKAPGREHRTRFRGVPRVNWRFTFSAGVYNLLRIAKHEALQATQHTQPA